MRRAGFLAVAGAVSLGQAAPPVAAVGGSLDRGFGTAGYITTRLGAQTTTGLSVDTVVAQPDGRLVMGGSVDGRPTAARFMPDGSRDPSFGSNGIARLSSVSNFLGRAVALDAAGRVLVAGMRGPSTAAVVAFTPSGAVDSSFGAAGVAQVAGFGAYCLAVQSDGAVVVAGGDAKPAQVARFTPTGGLDLSFGSNGVALASTMSTIRFAVLDGAAIVVGGQDNDLAVLERFTPTGALDTSFGVRGRGDAFIRGTAAGVGVGGGYYYLGVNSGAGGAALRFWSHGSLAARIDLPSVAPSNLVVDRYGQATVVGDTGSATSTGATSAAVEWLAVPEGPHYFISYVSCMNSSFFNWDQPFNRATSAVQVGDSTVIAGWTERLDGGNKTLVLARLRDAGRGTGYRLLNARGDTEAFGGTVPCETAAARPSASPYVAVASFRDGSYYSVGVGDYVAAADGGVFAFGAAPYLGSMAGTPLQAPIVSLTTTDELVYDYRPYFRHGYWLAAADGGVFAFGSARFRGSMAGKPLNAPIIGMAPTSSWGYWLAAADGGVFAFGEAGFFGSMGGRPLNAPIVGIASAGSGGYWLAAADGGVFAFGSAEFRGSMVGKPLNAPIVGIRSYGDGYWLLGRDGAVYAFGAAPFLGSMGARPSRGPWVGIG